MNGLVLDVPSTSETLHKELSPSAESKQFITHSVIKPITHTPVEGRAGLSTKSNLGFTQDHFDTWTQLQSHTSRRNCLHSGRQAN